MRSPARGPWLRLLVLLCASASAGGCASLGPVSDGTSLAYGWHNSGVLVNGVRLPAQGDGYVIPSTWSRRGLNFGTEELVSVIVRAARHVRAASPDATLYVADLSPRRGGPSAWHRSHQTGRDADLIFFAHDENGKPVPPPAQMTRYGADGATPATDAKGRAIRRTYFDVRRNWLLVRALLEGSAGEVQYLFIAAPLKRLLLAHAAEQREPAELIARADAILHQPGDSAPHDDHLHLRIYCPASDRSVGCRDRGPLRWFKKVYKYLAVARDGSRLPEAIRAAFAGPFCRLLGSSLFARL